MENSFVQSAGALEPVSQSACQEYNRKADRLIQFVNGQMAQLPDINRLIGGNPFEVMFDNHANHARFMANVFALGDYKMLAQTIVWVYRSYVNRGFSPDYFQTHLAKWIDAVDAHLLPAHASAINLIYQWIRDHHQEILALSRETPSVDPPEKMVDPEIVEQWTELLLAGNRQGAMSFAMERSHSKDEYRQFLLRVVQPTMEKIGTLWEQGKISVAAEHLASAIVRRVMTSLYDHIPLPPKEANKVVVTSVPEEQHDLGGLMVSDFLELEGFDTRFLGANTPSSDLANMISEEKPDFVLLSICMTYNLDRAKSLIREIRNQENWTPARIIVGGNALEWGKEDIWQDLGADGYAANAHEAVTLLQSMIEQHNP